MAPINTNLSKQKSTPEPEVPQARWRPLMGFKGQMPLPSNTVINSDTPLTPGERKQLESIGWKEGQPIPRNLPKILADHRAAMEEEIKAAALDPNIKPAKLEKIVKLEDLAPDKQKEILNAIEEVGGMFEKEEKQPPVRFVRSQPVKKTVVQQEPEPEEVKEEPAQAQPEETPAATSDEKKNCVHCGWPQETPDVEPSKEDIYNFVQHIVGDVRFVKKYSLYGGQVDVTFRSITTEESDLVDQQIIADIKLGKINSVPEYTKALMEYRLACCLDKIITSSENIRLPELNVYQVDEDDYKTSDPKVKNTKLVVVTPHVINSTLKGESLKRIVLRAFADFQRILEYCESRAEDPNFCTATEGLA